MSVFGSRVAPLLSACLLFAVACASPASAPSPTTAPAKPTTAPAAAPPTGAPAKPAAEAPKPTAAAAAPAIDVAKMKQYFDGKTIDLYIGYAPGGGYDIRGRIFAEFFQRHIPGNPRVAIQNLAGGGGLQATRQVMRAKPDGLTMVTIPSGVFLLELLGEKQEGFDIKQPKILGNYEVAAATYTPLWVRSELASNWDEVMAKGKSGTIFKYGAPAVGNAQALSGEWLSIVGAPVKVVYGYGGSNELLAAIDRKELDMMGVDDLADTKEASIPRSTKAFPEWFTSNPKFITPVLSTRETIPPAWLAQFDYKPAPNILDAVSATQVQKDAYKLAYAVREAVDPLSLPQGVPDDVFQTLKQAMIETCKDPEFIKAMKDRSFEGGYRAPEELEATINQLAAAPKEVVDILRRLYIGE